MIFYQNSSAVYSKVNKVRRQFLSSTHVEYDMKDTKNKPKVNLSIFKAHGQQSKDKECYLQYIPFTIHPKTPNHYTHGFSNQEFRYSVILR